MITLWLLAFSLVQDAPTPAPPKPVITAPKVKFAPEPNVSKCKLATGYDINVLVGLTIDVKGKPQGTQVLRSSGDVCTDKIALEAVNQYRFIPARKDGVVIPVEMNVEVQVKKF